MLNVLFLNKAFTYMLEFLARRGLSSRAGELGLDFVFRQAQRANLLQAQRVSVLLRCGEAAGGMEPGAKRVVECSRLPQTSFPYSMS
jgi:hypothetical protein